MPLIQASLQTQLLAVFQKATPLSAEAAQKMAGAYVSYAATGLFGASKPVFTGAELNALMATLLAAMNPLTGQAMTFAQAWQQGVIAFWMAPPITVVGAQSGVVTSIPGGSSIAAALAPTFSNPLTPAATAAAQLALALDTATKTVIATVAPPPATFVTIS